MNKANLAIYTFTILFLTNVPFLIYYTIRGSAFGYMNYRELGLTPAALMFILVGAVGLAAIIRLPATIKDSDKRRAKAQFFIGFGMLFACALALEILLRIAWA